MRKTYSLKAFKEAVTNYLRIEEDYNKFLKTLAHDSWQTMTKQEYQDYKERIEQTQDAWSTVMTMCIKLNIDYQTYASVFESAKNLI